MTLITNNISQKGDLVAVDVPSRLHGRDPYSTPESSSYVGVLEDGRRSIDPAFFLANNHPGRSSRNNCVCSRSSFVAIVVINIHLERAPVSTHGHRPSSLSRSCRCPWQPRVAFSPSSRAITPFHLTPVIVAHDTEDEWVLRTPKWQHHQASPPSPHQP